MAKTVVKLALHRKSHTARRNAGHRGTCSLDGRHKTIDQLKRIDYDLGTIVAELREPDIEACALRVLQKTLGEMRETVRTLWQGIERSPMSPGTQSFCEWLTGERMHQAVRLNTEIAKELEAGKIRTDQAALSSYARTASEAVDQLDRMFAQLKTQP